MNRREFVRDIAAAGAVVAAAGVPNLSARARARVADSEFEGQATAQDDNDRSTNRDPMAIQRSTLVVNGLDPSNLRVEYLDMLKEGGVNCWHRGGGNLSAFATALRFFDQHKDRIVSATSVRDIRQTHREGKIAHISGWQSADTLISDGGGRGPAIENLRAYHELGLRICGISYNVANHFGAGCAEPHIGLTRAGRRLVEEIHKRRILLDVSGHTGEQTSLDALEMSKGVIVVCTHTNVRALMDNPRTTTDREFEAIAKTGGVVGLTAFNDFHARTRNDAKVRRTPQVGLEKHLDQYDYLKKLIGVDHIGLGPDFVDGPGRNDEGSADRNRMPAEIYSEQPWFYVKGFESIAELPNVTRGLIRRGWSTAEIRKVLGENWLRVYEKVWGA
jgi:membrane dipeptidase